MWEVLNWVASIFSIVAYILNIYKKKACFIIWIIANGYLIIYGIHIENYASVVLWSVYTILSMYGLYNWRKDD